MNITEVLPKYGLDLASVATESGLVTLNTAYNGLCDSLVAESDSASSQAKAVRDSLANEDVSEIAYAVRQLIAGSISEGNDSILVALVDAVQGIKSDLMTLRDYHVAEIVKDSKPVVIRDTDAIESAKSEAATLREAIVAVHTLMGRPALKVVAETPEDSPEDFEPEILFDTKKNAEGETVPKLRKTPGGNASGNVGRGAKVRQMRWELNGNMIPEGTQLTDFVRRYLCNFAEGLVWKHTDIKEAVDARGYTFLAEGYDNRWTIQMGRNVVSGWLPVDLDTKPSSSLDEDDDDNEADSDA